MRRILVCVDVSNIYYCIGKKFEGRRLNYEAYVRYAKDLGDVVKLIAYGAQKGKEANAFIYCLRKLGFETKYKEPRTFKNGTQTRHKADWDVGIAMDIVNAVEMKSIDTLILGTADGDLAPCVEWAKARGVSVIILACGIARELKKLATKFIEIPESFLEEVIGGAQTTVDNSPKDEGKIKGSSNEASSKTRENANKP